MNHLLLKSITKSLILLCVFCTAASADVLLETDFSGSTKSGAVLSNINWTATGINDPGNLTVGGDATSFNTSSDAGGYVVPNINTDNGGEWSFSIPIAFGGDSLQIDSLVLDGAMFDSGGDFQNVTRETDFSVSLMGSISGAVATDTGTAQTAVVSGGSFTGNAANSSWGAPLVFDFGGQNLSTSETWSLSISTVNRDGNGNFTGLDALTINGAVIPEPNSILLLGLAGLVLLVGRSTRRK